ncbi:protein Exd1 homolog [Scaptodrosophila lebanonensis]|uniref:Protein Exd1 homolog n=1 Tax=Drosophila lebanonensis TaxID=7225 RepID=A0A6J2T6L2_DROLE|nr:protein Exd1 homolog [Scaptodrosophila lebanonensis]XP_030372587.1 protein Exd1 homolog [Scaptodrosophila lebanonensis]
MAEKKAEKVIKCRLWNNDGSWRSNDSSSDDDNESFISAISHSDMDIFRILEPLTSMLPHELDSIDQKLQRLVFINQTDVKYHRALQDIREQSIVSMILEPSFYGRHQRTSIIVIATANNTYIFDMQALDFIFKDLRYVLEADHPRKIVHYSHRICNHLLSLHNIKLGGICDTFVELCIARKQNKPSTLSEAIALVLKVSLSEPKEITESRRLFKARPMYQYQLDYLAKMALYQEKLHDRLIYEVVCEKMLSMSKKFSESFDKIEFGSDIMLGMQPLSEQGFEHINPYHCAIPYSVKIPSAKDIEAHDHPANNFNE